MKVQNAQEPFVFNSFDADYELSDILQSYFNQSMIELLCNSIKNWFSGSEAIKILDLALLQRQSQVRFCYTEYGDHDRSLFALHWVEDIHNTA